MKEKVGYPWTTLPDFMFEHAGQGYAGHGTLCGALGVSSYLINLAVYDEKGSYRTVIDRMMWWYAGMKFPTDRFDDISSFPKQVQAQAMTPLCHTSVSKWTLAVNLVEVYRALGGGWEIRLSENAGEIIPQETQDEMRAHGKYWKAAPKKE